MEVADQQAGAMQVEAMQGDEDGAVLHISALQVASNPATRLPAANPAKHPCIRSGHNSDTDIVPHLPVAVTWRRCSRHQEAS
eukprot:364743-Chlamydomonas_euryale.AAC.14